MVVHEHAVTDREIGHARTYVDHFSHRLVPQNLGFALVPGHRLATAKTAGQRFQKHLARSDLRYRSFLQSDVVDGILNGGLHGGHRVNSISFRSVWMR